ncbi:MAG: nucleotidyltransferase domain-containing protein [Acidobacteriota bacterium]
MSIYKKVKMIVSIANLNGILFCCIKYNKYKMWELLKLFSSKVRVKLLDAFLSSPNARFYIREIERKIGEDIQNIHKELKNLEALGLLQGEIQGNQKYYSANKEFFLYPELKSIIFKTIGIKGLLKEALSKLKGIEAAFIYGSYAAGEESEESDIDVLIIGKPDMTKLRSRR